MAEITHPERTLSEVEVAVEGRVREQLRFDYGPSASSEPPLTCACGTGAGTGEKIK